LDKEKSIRFWVDLLSDLELGMLFLLRLVAVRENSVTSLLFARCQHYIADVLVMNLILVLCTSLSLRVKTYSLVEICTLMSAL